MTAIAGVLISTAGTVAAQTPATLVASHAEAAQAAKLGQEAYAAGKLDVFLVEMRRAYAERPDHPRIIYNLSLIHISEPTRPY